MRLGLPPAPRSAFFPLSIRMCYNHRVVERAENSEPAPVAAATDPDPPQEDASGYCPVCSQRLGALRCKLICPVCGYYMSCSDYY